MQNNLKKVAVVLPTFNRKDYLVECLDALLKQTYKVSDIYITDNNSSDGTEDLLKEKRLIGNINGTTIHYRKLNINGGGAMGFSLGMETAYNDGADAFWMMDDDGLPDPKALEFLMQYLGKYNFVAPVVLSRTHRDKLVMPFMDSLDPNILLEHYHGKIMKGYVNPFNGGLYSRKLVSEVGFPKKELFIYGDEINYMQRCEDKGYICYGIYDAKHYHPEYVVKDHERWGKLVHFLDKPLAMYCQTRNEVYNMKRRISKKPLYYILRLIYMPLEFNLFVLLKHPSWKWFALYNRAYIDGLFSKWGGAISVHQEAQQLKEDSDRQTTTETKTKFPSKVDVAVLCLFFNRPDNFGQVFEQVRKARPSKLFLYQDGPREGRNDLPGILECRKIAENIDWECEVHQHYCEKNQGCDPSEYLSQKWMFSYVDKGIILEDDDVPSQSFFPFCKELLDKYENDPRVAIISGINYEEDSTSYCPYDYFFTEDMAIWGWATWKRVIDGWEGDYAFMKDKYHMSLMAKYIKEANMRNLIPMMKWHSESGKEYYESILLAYMYLHHSLAIVPSKNMINNIGWTNGVHSGTEFEDLPKGLRPLYTMKRYEIDFPLKHPKYMIDNLFYKDATDKLLARNKPFTAFMRNREVSIRKILNRIKRLFHSSGTK